MKRTFLVEIDYEEKENNIKENTLVLQDIAIEIALDNLMEGYIDTNSISDKYYSVEVRELS